MTLLAVHVLPTQVRVLHDPVSSYRLTPYRPWTIVSKVSLSIAAGGTIIGLAGLLGRHAVVACVLLALFAISTALLTIMPMDARDTASTTGGRVHNALAFIGFASVTAAALVVGSALLEAGFDEAAIWSTVLGGVMAVGAAGLLIGAAAQRTNLFGLFERLIYAGFILWFILIGITEF